MQSRNCPWPLDPSGIAHRQGLATLASILAFASPGLAQSTLPVPNPTTNFGVAEGLAPARNAQHERLDAHAVVGRHNGELLYSVTDLSLEGRARDLVFTRAYRSQVSYLGPFGPGWTHCFDHRVELDSAGGLLHFDADRFTVDTYGPASPTGLRDCTTAGIYRKARAIGGQTYEVRDAGGLRWRFLPIDGSATSGRLSRVIDSFGNEIVAQYDESGQLSALLTDRYDSATAPSRRLDLVYAGGRIERIVDVHSARAWTFTYGADGALESASTPAVATLVGGGEVVAPRTTAYSYTAADLGVELGLNLQTVTYPGHVEPRLEFSYDDTDRVDEAFVRSVSGDENPPSLQFLYSAGSLSGALARTVVVDRVGQPWTYSIGGGGQVVRFEDPLSNVARYEYNADGELTRHVHPAGNEHRYTWTSTSVADRFQQGNKLRTESVPAPGQPGSPDPYVTQHRHEPVYNQVVPTLDEGRTLTFDYEEDPQSIATLVADWGIAYVAGTPKGDVNGDGRVDQGGGAVVESRSPELTTGLPSGSSGPVTLVETTTFDDYGRVLTRADAEGTLTLRQYVDGNLSAVVQDAAPDPAVYPNSGTARWNRPPEIQHVEALTTLVSDGRGNILTVTDPRGVRSDYSYNALDEIVSQELAAGYDSGQLDPTLASLVTAGYPHLVARGVGRTFAYDGSGLLAEVETDNWGSGDSALPTTTSRMTYNLEGLATSIEEELGGAAWASTTMAYDDGARQVLVVDPEGKVTATVYDELGREKEVREGSGPDGAVLAVTAVTTYEYDANGNVVAVEGPEDLDGDGHRERTVFEFDGRDRLHRTISPTGVESVGGYSPRGWPIRREIRGRIGGPSGTQNGTAGNSLLSVTDVEVDRLGSAVRTQRLNFLLGTPAGTAGPVWESRRDRNRMVVEELDPEGELTTIEYDGLNRARVVTDPVGNRTLYTYDAGGLVTEVTIEQADPFGGTPIVRRLEYVYDGLGRMVRHVRGREVTWFNYDAVGNLVVEVDGRSLGSGPDPLGLHAGGALPLPGNSLRLALERTVAGFTLRVHSDLSAGGVADGAYDPWSASFDPSVAPASVATETSTIRHDRVGNVVEVDTAGGRKISFDYDELHRLQTKTFPDGSSTVTSYWRNGLVRRHSMSDSSDTLFRSTESFYDGDGLHRQTLVLNADAAYSGTVQLSFEWNGLGRPTRLADLKQATDLVDSVVTRTYDSLGRTRSENQNGRTVQFNYDDRNRTSVVFPGGRTIERRHDPLGRLDQLIDVGGNATLVDYQYYGGTQLLAEANYGNGTAVSFQLPGPGSVNGYSASDRIERFEFRRPGGTVDAIFATAYDGAGQRTQRLRQVGASLTGELATHDSRGRLSFFQQQLDALTTIVKAWGRDGDGEWTAQGAQVVGSPPSLYSYVSTVDDWAYDSIAGRSLDHDAAGNRIQDDWFDYEYDAFDRLVRVEDRYSGAEVARYSYDALTRRIGKVDWLGGETGYIYDGQQILETRDGTGAVVDQYVHGRNLDELVQWVDAGGQERFFQLDEVGSIVAVTDGNGVVLERVAYDAFGAPTFLDSIGNVLTDSLGVPLAESSLGNRFLLHGRDYDAELAHWRRAQESPAYFAETPAAGQYNFRYRFMSPEEGRFVGRDPLAIGSNDPVDPSILVRRIMTGESESPYEFAAGSPADRVDPFGLSTVYVRPGTTSKGIEPDSFDVPDAEALRDFGNTDFLLAMSALGLHIIRGNSITSHVSCQGPTSIDGIDPDGPSGRSSGGRGPSSGPKPEPPTPPKPPKPPTTPGTGGKLLKGAAKVGGRLAGAAAAGAGPVLSVIEVSGSQSGRFNEFMFRCASTLGGVAAIVIDDLEERIDSGPGLPQPSPPKPKATSVKLFRDYVKAFDKWKQTTSDRDPMGDMDLNRERVRLKEEGKAMSCIYFSRNSRFEGHKGPIANLDCRDAWSANDQQSTDLPGTGSSQPQSSTPDEDSASGDDGEQASLLDRDRMRVRVAALDRFEGRNRAGAPAGDPVDGSFPLQELLAVALVGLSASRLRLGL